MKIRVIPNHSHFFPFIKKKHKNLLKVSRQKTDVTYKGSNIRFMSTFF